MKKITILFLALLFLGVNGIVFMMTYQNGKDRVEIVLEDSLQTLQTHYKILLETQKSTALAIYGATINTPRVIEVLSQVKVASQEERVVLRRKLKKLLTPIYDGAKIKGVLQYQFVFPDNISFLRMHKPSKHGDDLTDVRHDFRYVNETKKPIRGFVQGRVAHGFRNAFPIFDKENNHIGAVEVSFSSDRFQWFLNNVSDIHTHFLVHKKVFDVKFWQRDDAFLQYSNSAESSDYMISLGALHSKKRCIDDNKIKFKNIREEVNTKISKGNSFSLYAKHENHLDLISFLPIKGLKDNSAVAWLVSYEKNEFIQTTLRNITIIRVVTLIFSLFLIYFIAQLIISRKKLSDSNIKLHDLALNDPLTGLRNRLYLESDIQTVIENYKEHHAPYAVLMFDIDWFKEVNDTYGHDIGDLVLKELSAILKSSIREEDKVYRAGGEEFVVLLNRITYSATVKIAEKIRLLIQNYIFNVKGKKFNKTISVGLYHSSILEAKDVKHVLKLIDIALYKSKNDGRNRVTEVIADKKD